MNATLAVQVVSVPSASTNPFDNKIDLITMEGIFVWKTARDPNKLLDCIALTIKNGDKFLARMSRKCSEFWLIKFIWIPIAGNVVLANLQGGLWKCFGEYRKLMYNYHELFEDQVIALACYYWGGNDAQCAKLYTLVTVPLDFTAVEP